MASLSAALQASAARYEEMALSEDDLLPFVREFSSRIGEYPETKLCRWLGYIQGVLIERGYTTVQAERDWSRPIFRPVEFSTSEKKALEVSMKSIDSSPAPAGE